MNPSPVNDPRLVPYLRQIDLRGERERDFQAWIAINDTRPNDHWTWDLVVEGLLEERDGFVRLAADPAAARADFAARVARQLAEEDDLAGGRDG